MSLPVMEVFVIAVVFSGCLLAGESEEEYLERVERERAGADGGPAERDGGCDATADGGIDGGDGGC